MNFQLRNIIFVIFLLVSVTETVYCESLKIGQSLPLSGEKSKAATAFLNGTKAWIEHINSRGGINGSELELITLDDKGNPNTAAENTKKLIDKDVFLLFGYMGYESAKESADIASENAIPFFGAATGAGELHKFPEKNIFTVRPSYYNEINNIIKKLLDNGDNKISFFHSLEGWGLSALKSAEWSFDDNNISIFSKAGVNTNAPDVNKAVSVVNSGNPDAVILAADYQLSSKFIKTIRNKNPDIKIFALCDTLGDKLSQSLMNQGVGVVVSQVVPFPFYTKLPVSQLFNRLSRKYFPEQSISFFGFEGFITARALTTIISNCPKNPERNDFIKAAESTGSVNLGGYVFNFSESKRTGSVETYLTQIGPGGFLSPIRSLEDIYKHSQL
ncbi:MAG: ABC transporter substrate-binding protein [Thermodesulfobacteriota bacterium]